MSYLKTKNTEFLFSLKNCMILPKNVLVASIFVLHIFCVVKHLLKKKVQIILLKHCFERDDGGLANECTEALNAYF